MPIPLLLVNGFAPFPFALLVLCERFQAAGIHCETVSFHPDAIRSLDDYADRVERAAFEVLRRTGSDRLHIAGYSAGAIASYIAVLRPSLAPHVAGYAGLGGPYSGSVVSWLMQPTRLFSKIAAQLLPNSRYLYDLLERRLARHIRVLTLAGRKDRVCPPGTALLEYGTRYSLPVSHLSLLTSERVFHLLHGFLYSAA